jgi:DNA-binding IclR family transcriptional regulator
MFRNSGYPYMIKKTRAAGSAAERTLALLALLAHSGKAQSLANLSEALSLPKATVHRLTTQLLEAGFIAKANNDKEFLVGAALRRLALDTLNHDTTQGLRHVVLADLVKEIGETCNFTTLDGASVRYLDRVEAAWPWRLTLEVGAQVPLHCTASGKLFLAFMAPEIRQKVLSTLSLQPMTDFTITDRHKLEIECDGIVNHGYSIDRQEFVVGLIAIAVPVKNSEGSVLGGLAVHAPTSRLTVEGALKHLSALQNAAERMSKLL